jgi:hypothetical protein
MVVKRTWIEIEGLKTVMGIYAEQKGIEGPLPDPEKYVDQSYLKQALKELGLR